MIYLNKKKPKRFVIFGVLALILVIIIFIVGTSTSWGENVFGTVTSPVQGLFNSVGGSIGNFFNGLFSSSDTNAELNTLRQRVTELESEKATLQENKAENDRLKSLLDIKDVFPGDYEYKAGRVISKPDGTWFDTFTINIGTSSGVEEGMPVVNGKGLIGRIYKPGVNWSTVISVIDGRSAVSVLIERTRYTCVAKGDVMSDSVDRPLSLEYLPHQADVMTGDRVITSGLGGVFPKGLLVGEIIESGYQSDGSVIAYVKPVDDFKRLEEVLVLMTKPETLEPSLTEQTE